MAVYVGLDVSLRMTQFASLEPRALQFGKAKPRRAGRVVSVALARQNRSKARDALRSGSRESVRVLRARLSLCVPETLKNGSFSIWRTFRRTRHLGR